MIYKFRRATKMAAIVGLLLGLFIPAGARAGSYFFAFTNVYDGLTPMGSPNWVNTMFSDVSPGTVQLTISASGLADGEFLSAVFFNLDPSLNPTKLNFSYVSSSGGFALPSITDGANFVKADGLEKFDVYFSFSQKAATAFTGNDYITYDITSSAYTLTAADFDFLSPSAGNFGPLLASAEISGIPVTNDSLDNGWIGPCQLTPAPEPRSISLLALAAGLLGASCWQNRRARRV
jgi:hypothetical protein